MKNKNIKKNKTNEKEWKGFAKKMRYMRRNVHKKMHEKIHMRRDIRRYMSIRRSQI